MTLKQFVIQHQHDIQRVVNYPANNSDLKLSLIKSAKQFCFVFQKDKNMGTIKAWKKITAAHYDWIIRQH